jgi:hypothetical protein
MYLYHVYCLILLNIRGIDSQRKMPCSFILLPIKQSLDRLGVSLGYGYEDPKNKGILVV